MTAKWITALWEELDALDELEQITAAAEWIIDITHEVLPELGQRRRTAIRAMLDRPNWDHVKLAETIGTRPSTIRRLMDESRAYDKRKAKQAAPVDEPPPLPVS